MTKDIPLSREMAKARREGRKNQTRRVAHEAGKPRAINEHELKTWPVYFEAIWSGQKTFEIRRNDRDFKEGDRLTLYEYDPEAPISPYSGRHIIAEVTYRMPGGRWGIAEDYCVMAIKVIHWFER